MYRRFIATVAAASIAITALGAVPARADERDIARALAVILGIAAVGKIIHDDKKKRERAVTRHYNPPIYDAPRRHKHPQVQQRRYDQHIQPRPLPRHVRNDKLLPGQCFRSYDTRRGTVRMFGNRCLKNNFRHANRLPQHCKVHVRTYNGDRSGYQARCLRDAGYRLARG